MELGRDPEIMKPIPLLLPIRKRRCRESHCTMNHGCPTHHSQPWQPLTYFCLYEFNSSPSKWNHTIFVLLCLCGFIPLSIMFPGRTVAHVSISIFVWVNNVPLCVHTTFCLPNHLLTDSRDVSTCRLLWIMLP